MTVKKLERDQGYLKSGKKYNSGSTKKPRDDVFITDENGFAEDFNKYLTTIPVQIGEEIPSTAAYLKDYIRD